MAPLVILIVYLALIVVFFAVKRNRGTVVDTASNAGDEVEAIDFYWRPG